MVSGDDVVEKGDEGAARGGVGETADEGYGLVAHVAHTTLSVVDASGTFGEVD